MLFSCLYNFYRRNYRNKISGFRTKGRLILFASLIISPVVISAQRSPHLHGEATLPNGTIVRIKYYEEGKEKTDSSTIQNNLFNFKFFQTDIKQAQLSMDKLPGYKLLFIDANTSITIDTSKIWQSRIYNSSANVEFEEKNKYVESLQLAVQKALQERSKIAKSDSLSLKSNAAIIEKANQDYWDYKVTFIKNHPESIISLFYLRDVWNVDKYKDELPILLSSLSTSNQKHNLFSNLQQKLANLNITKVGNLISVSSFNNYSGQEIKLENLKSKYVLFNFWGTWCGPCIAEIPSLIQLYKNYDRRVFDIVSIAYEDSTISKKFFSSVLKDKQLEWHNTISYRNQEKGSMVKAFGISVYPTNVLINCLERRVVWVGTGRNSPNELSKILEH